MPERLSGLLRRNFTIEPRHERMLALLEEHGFSRSYVVRRGIEIVYWLFRHGHDIEQVDENTIRSLPRARLVLRHFSLADKIAELHECFPDLPLALAHEAMDGPNGPDEAPLRHW